jgi:hypothetical protein
MKHKNSTRDQNQKPASASWPTAAANLSQSGIDFAPSQDQVARMARFSYGNQGSLPGHEVQDCPEAEAQLIAERNITRVHGFHNQTHTFYRQPTEQQSIL